MEEGLQLKKKLNKIDNKLKKIIRKRDKKLQIKEIKWKLEKISVGKYSNNI